MGLYFYNTLSRKKEKFKPIRKGQVNLYTCGPTVYSYAHIGNLRTYVFEDILKRVLLYNNYKVKHVMNITDVGHLTSDADTGEDKVETASKRENKTAWEIAEFYTTTFQEDLKKLNILPPTIWCKATGHIKEQVEWITQLEKAGYTYKTSDGVYFDTSKFKDYGKLALLERQQLQAGKRIAVGEKRCPTDFALWKFSPKNEKRQMEWPSPWGVGFPGWHIECSVMATKYLGKQFDIHCGGVDHIPIHHTNEIAQTEAVTKKRWVNYWLHGEFLVLEDEKMSKSKGNILIVSALKEQGCDPLDYRYLCLNTHYRKQLTFSKEALDGAKSSRKKMVDRIEELKETAKKGKINKKYQEQFHQAINDDLNAPEALAIVWNVLKDEKVNAGDKLFTLYNFDEVLGLRLKEQKARIPPEVTRLAEQRLKERKKKDFKEADRLREEIAKAGFITEDTESGFRIKRK